MIDIEAVCGDGPPTPSDRRMVHGAHDYASTPLIFPAASGAASFASFRRRVAAANNQMLGLQATDRLMANIEITTDVGVRFARIAALDGFPFLMRR
jgi:hypothetical protein